nr:MAG TPA: hypothetical protein [Caudoviricetes sp.]
MSTLLIKKFSFLQNKKPRLKAGDSSRIFIERRQVFRSYDITYL